uniref:Vesicle transport protein USE1 n=1 Tax=Haemonchus contortus TaxID=6289 RepID=W6NN96_HAECO
MSLTASELSFLRLLERTKKLAREDLAENVWKVNAAVLYLENLYSRLQDEKTLHNGDLLMQYGRELNQMKLLVEAERCKSAEEKLSQLDLIPRRFPDTGIELHSHNPSKPASYRPLETVSEVRVRNRAVYRADLRKQLLGEEEQRRQNASASDDLVQHEEKQESIANELLSLTRSLKQNMTVAGNVLKDDNKRLSSMHAQVDANTAQLKTEGTRLAHHAYKCGFDCALVFVALFIFWSFICMVVVMKIFPKRVAS